MLGLPGWILITILLRTHGNHWKLSDPYAMIKSSSTKGTTLKTSTPDFVSDFQVQFEEWVMSVHEDICICQACDPELHMELFEEWEGMVW